MLDKMKGALFGLAIGDALGGTTEFLSKAAIERKYGLVDEIVGGHRRGIGWFGMRI